MLDLWYSEFHADDVKLSIKVDRHIHNETSAFQQIDFFDSQTLGRFFTLDGLMMVNEKDEFAYHDMICHPAFAVSPGIKTVLIIGGGDGGTARECARYAGVERIDMVEIDERVVRLCQQYLPQTAAAMGRDPRIHLYFEDGLAFVANAPDGAYDLVLVDSTDPIGPGEGLFTEAFYLDCFRVLNDRGILVNQHESPYYERDVRRMMRAHAKLHRTFPVAKVYEFHIPTYPSGHWLFGFASKGQDPVKDIQADEWNGLGLKTRYYNTELHRAAFALPSYVNEYLERARNEGWE